MDERGPCRKVDSLPCSAYMYVCLWCIREGKPRDSRQKGHRTRHPPVEGSGWPRTQPRSHHAFVSLATERPPPRSTPLPILRGRSALAPAWCCTDWCRSRSAPPPQAGAGAGVGLAYVWDPVPVAARSPVRALLSVPGRARRAQRMRKMTTPSSPPPRRSPCSPTGDSTRYSTVHLLSPPAWQ